MQGAARAVVDLHVVAARHLYEVEVEPDDVRARRHVLVEPRGRSGPSNLEPRTSNLEPRISNLESRIFELWRETRYNVRSFCTTPLIFRKPIHKNSAQCQNLSVMKIRGWG